MYGNMKHVWLNNINLSLCQLLALNKLNQEAKSTLHVRMCVILYVVNNKRYKYVYYLVSSISSDPAFFTPTYSLLLSLCSPRGPKPNLSRDATRTHGKQ